MREIHKENLKSLADRTTEEQRKIASMGGKASVKARQERKTVAQALLDALLQKCPTGNTYYDEIMSRCSVNTLSNPTFKDVEVLQKILGEQAVQKLEVTLPQIKVESKADAESAGEVGETFQ